MLRIRLSGWLLCLPLAVAADVFTGQLSELERYHISEIRKALAAGPRHRPQLLAERLGTVAPPARANALRTLVAVWPELRIEELRIEVEPGHFAHALLLSPAGEGRKVMIAVGPADRTPEAWAGLTEKHAQPSEWLANLVASGYAVCLPVGVQRTKDHAMSESTRGKDRRHILHRLGFVTGRTVTGLEVTEIRGLAASLHRAETGLYGEGDGAWTALMAAAADPGRFSSLNLIDAPETGENAWRDPVDRTIFGLFSDFGGAPRPAHKPAAIRHAAQPLRAGERLLNVEIEERRNRHFNGLLDFLRARIRASADVRRARHKLTSTPPRQAVPKLLADLRATIGEVPAPTGPLNARMTELNGTGRRFKAYDVRLDVVPGVEAYGQLLVPREAEGKRLAAVVTQHGLGGKPKDLTLQGPEPNAAYHGYAARLADHGYVVFAPYVVVPIPQAELINPLVRMTNLLGRMRTNIEVAKLRRIVDFLETLPSVDRTRLGYYGLSYGGYSTIWMGPLEPRFRATVISGHFNDWAPKITNESERTSYLQHPDEDFSNWDVLNRLTHAELVASFWPRAVMVEFAQHDGTTFPAWHEKAWGEVEQIAAAWQAADRFVRDRFAGIHEIHGIGAFDFLDRWLRPERPSSRGFEDWGGEVSHRLEAKNPLTWVRGEFRVGSGEPWFRGLAFAAAKDSGPLEVRFGTTAGGNELGQVEAKPAADGWARAAMPKRRLDPSRQYFFELRPGTGTDSSALILGPKPLGGTRFAGEFAVRYRPLP